MEHQEKPAEEVEEKEEHKTSYIFPDEFPPEFKLSNEALQRLSECEEVKSLLANPYLREYLTHVNTTHNPKRFADIAMREPLFVEFADACLR